MGDTKAARAARGAKRTVRRRAVGTRDRIIAHLISAGDIEDATGMASTRLAEAVEYPGSSVAFAQLLSGMERDGLVAREVRGKRTYRITLPEGVAAAHAAAQAAKAAGNGVTSLSAAVSAAALPGQPGAADAPASASACASVPGEAGFAGLTGLPSELPGPVTPGLPGAAPSGLPGAVPPGGGIDYDELARRLLVQVIRKLAAVPDADIASADAPGALAEENARLREQLIQTQRALELERARRSPLAGELNQADVVVLEHLLDQPGETA